MTDKISKYISYYQLKTWSECKKLHFLQSIEKSLKKETSQYQSYGLALEDTIEKMILEKTLEEEVSSDESISFFNEYYENNLKDANEVKADLGESHKIAADSHINHLYEFLNSNFPSFNYLHSQYKIFEKLDYDSEEFNFYFNGYADLIFEHGDIIYVVDYKTSNNGWSDSDKQNRLTLLQLYLYKLFLQEKEEFKGKEIKTQFWIFQTNSPKIEVVDVDVLEDDLVWSQRKINAMIYKAFIKQEYPKNIICNRFCKCKQLNSEEKS